MAFLLEIITPERKAYEETVDAVTVPTTEGYIGVLAHHIPLFTLLTEGEIKIGAGSKEFFLAIGGGFMEITGSRVSILVTRAVHADELNEAEIKKAETSARDSIAKRAKGAELASAQAVLRRSVLEMKILRRRHHRLTV
ncbi:ATP synthase F1 subunit epsilon [Candidatus Gottesmanbacteria bacterium RIFCSPHIGHO2_01_FULL_46_14]|uniref:ATP synthase epsilon chain n=2 Tax=Candidatus Gottesmaniibacteriota TaxID=1752720 RepID=A0A1F5ZKT7_9BACT|nr:MAG: ATP synthase F1 subunit epsilon [Candidatus Gottesmanbacteria bacterium RIFCSPHIGHO2_01_FULL_46_14]OGG29027.1 MAG: ATP synthase F1 subunit epsilon [Candidatus Gottesmanbacteria bacterium RIFCSPLOWO2_01_FULL_46_21]